MTNELLFSKRMFTLSSSLSVSVSVISNVVVRTLPVTSVMSSETLGGLASLTVLSMNESYELRQSLAFLSLFICFYPNISKPPLPFRSLSVNGLKSVS